MLVVLQKYPIEQFVATLRPLDGQYAPMSHTV
jgi:hypothetical protein